MAQLLVGAGVTAPGERADYVVLGTVASRVWRTGLARGVGLEAVRSAMADFKAYLRVDVTPGEWYREADAAAIVRDSSHEKTSPRRRGRKTSPGT